MQLLIQSCIEKSSEEAQRALMIIVTMLIVTVIEYHLSVMMSLGRTQQ